MAVRRNTSLIPGSGLDHLLTDLHRRLGVDFRQYRTGTLERRVNTRLKVTGCEDYLQYIDYLHRQPGEYEKLLDVLTVNVTEFFRDPSTYAVIEHSVLPTLIESARVRGSKVMNVWSAGSSSGEEAYSLAILLDEILGPESRLRVRIIGTDIDRPSLERARVGVYPASAVKNVSIQRLSRYFRDEGDQVRVVDDLKRNVTFMQQSLLHPEQLPMMDLILCRNVAIYFTPALQTDLYAELCNHLQPWGFMVLGRVESLWGASKEWFTAVDNRERVYVKRA